MNSALLELDQVTAGYGEAAVLHAVSFAVAEGGVTALLGANGAGKTTTLRAISGMLRTAGAIRYRGGAIQNRPTEEIARARDRPCAGWARHVHGTHRRGESAARRLQPQATRSCAAISNGSSDISRVLRARLRQQAGTLSGGEQQMLAIARALLLRPRLLLLDEPSFGLAPLIVRDLFAILARIKAEEGIGILHRRAERKPGARARRRRLSARDRPRRRLRPGRRARARRGDPPLLSGLLSAVADLLHQILSGIATGGIYASVALALVMIYQATHHVNFAQGEMATFSTYIALTLITAGLPYWAAFLLTIAISFLMGIAIQRVLMRPMANAPVLTAVGIFIGLLLIFNALSGWIFGYTIKTFPSPFETKTPVLGGYVSGHELGSTAVTLLMLLAVWAFFRFTTLGLTMRAAAYNPVSSRLVGIRVGWMLALGWGLAAAIGAVAGMLVAPVVFLDPNMMGGMLLYALRRRAARRHHQPARRGGRRIRRRDHRESRRRVSRRHRAEIHARRRRSSSSCCVVRARRAVRAPDREPGMMRGAHLPVVILCVLVAAIPAFLLSDYRLFQLTMVAAYAVAILGLNIVTGYNGQISLGHGAFYAVGAYVTAILMATYDWPYWATLPVVGDRLARRSASRRPAGAAAERALSRAHHLRARGRDAAAPEIQGARGVDRRRAGHCHQQAGPAFRAAAQPGPVALSLLPRRRRGRVRASPSTC